MTCTDDASQTVVIARLDRVTQYSAAVVINLIGCGVLDHPLSRVMTSCCVASLQKPYLIGGAYWMPPALQS